MEDLNHQEIFFNRAEMTDAQRSCCEKCFEQVVFTLRDNEHTFSMGLTTVLECLVFAVRNGELPKLPQSWLAAADSVCDTQHHFDEELCYYDYKDLRKRE